MDNMVIPPDHENFQARILAGKIDEELSDCAVAYIAPGGGGPRPPHIHEHDHLFTVLEGKITVRTGEGERIVEAGEALRVPGNILHSVWNLTKEPAKVLGISLHLRKADSR